MKIKFSVKEVLQLAEKIEKNGEKFYRAAAQVCPKHADFLSMLADKEVVHESFFKKFQHERLDPNKKIGKVDDPEGSVQSYLHAVADGLIFDIGDDPNEICMGKDDIEDIIDLAQDREEETILFFIGVKELMKTDQDKKLIDELIQEEMSHIAWLNEQRDLLPKRHPLV